MPVTYPVLGVRDTQTVYMVGRGEDCVYMVWQVYIHATNNHVLYYIHVGETLITCLCCVFSHFVSVFDAV